MFKKTFIAFVIFLWGYQQHSFAQIKFYKTIGGSCETEGNFIQQCSDSGYVIVASNCYGIYVVRTNINGDTLWTGMYADSIFSYLAIPTANCIRQTTDHGFIISGMLSSEGYALKIDSFGNKQWWTHLAFSGAANQTSYANILVQDTGGYIISGYEDDSGPDNYAFYFGLSDLGDTTFTRVISSGGGTLQDFKQTTDGGIIALSCYQGSNTYYLVKYGGTQGDWIKSIGYIPYTIVPLADSGYIISAAWPDSVNIFDFGIIYVDSVGDSLWSKTLNFGIEDMIPVYRSGDSGYIMLSGKSLYKGSTDEYNEDQNSDLSLIKTDFAGNVLWTKSFGGFSAETGGNLIMTYDGYSIAGSTKSEAGYSEIIFIKTDFSGNDQ